MSVETVLEMFVCVCVCVETVLEKMFVEKQFVKFVIKKKKTHPQVVTPPKTI